MDLQQQSNDRIKHTEQALSELDHKVKFTPVTDRKAVVFRDLNKSTNDLVAFKAKDNEYH